MPPLRKVPTTTTTAATSATSGNKKPPPSPGRRGTKFVSMFTSSNNKSNNKSNKGTDDDVSTATPSLDKRRTLRVIVQENLSNSFKNFSDSSHNLHNGSGSNKRGRRPTTPHVNNSGKQGATQRSAADLARRARIIAGEDAQRLKEEEAVQKHSRMFRAGQSLTARVRRCFRRNRDSLHGISFQASANASSNSSIDTSNSANSSSNTKSFSSAARMFSHAAHHGHRVRRNSIVKRKLDSARWQADAIIVCITECLPLGSLELLVGCL
jgi:hypothetical protein